MILLAGLQGAGKTTTAAKLARWLKAERSKKVRRCPRTSTGQAIEQLKLVAEQAGAQFFRRLLGINRLTLPRARSTTPSAIISMCSLSTPQAASRSTKR